MRKRVCLECRLPKPDSQFRDGHAVFCLACAEALKAKLQDPDREREPVTIWERSDGVLP